MKVSNLELSKELYELSGWADTDFIYYANGGVVNSNVEFRQMVMDKPEHLPAYDCGYLLRKLPKQTLVASRIDFWTAGIGSKEFLSQTQRADTPEDALCKLSISLFKEGILKKEEACL